MVNNIKKLFNKFKCKQQQISDGSVFFNVIIRDLKLYESFDGLNFYYKMTEFKQDTLYRGGLYVSDKLGEKTICIDITFDFSLEEKRVIFEDKNYHFRIRDYSRSFEYLLYDIIRYKFKQV